MLFYCLLDTYYCYCIILHTLSAMASFSHVLREVDLSFTASRGVGVDRRWSVRFDWILGAGHK